MAEVTDIKPESTNGLRFESLPSSSNSRGPKTGVDPSPSARPDSRGETPGTSTKVSGSGKGVIPRATVDLSKVPRNRPNTPNKG